MRYFIAIAALGFFFASCKKDKYTTIPQITYQSIVNNAQDASFPISSLGGSSAKITFSVTDAEGDIGYKDGKDTSYIYIKSLVSTKLDSLVFPDLTSISKSDFKANVSFFLPGDLLECRTLPGGLSHTDTLYYEIYIKDFAKNKSNVIRTGDPVFFRCQ